MTVILNFMRELLTIWPVIEGVQSVIAASLVASLPG